MKLTQVPKFSGPHGAIEFVRVADVPGYPYRVAFNGSLTKIWVPDGAGRWITKKTAEFYIRVIYAQREGREKYYYTDRNEDPPLPSPP